MAASWAWLERERGMTNIYPLALLILMLAGLYFLQRRMHFETQAIFLLLTRRSEIAVALFSILFLPGVFLHEVSHFVTARMLGVRTGKFSLIPQPLPDGRIRLGYVETAATDFVRDALIGIAPLMAGGAFVIYAGYFQLGLPDLWAEFQSAQVGGFLQGLARLQERTDFWLWFYLIFAVSSTMMPSASDRRAWLPITLFILIVVAVVALVEEGRWLVEVWDRVAPPVNRGVQGMTMAFGISSAVHLVLLPPLWAVRRSLTRLTGLRVA